MRTEPAQFHEIRPHVHRPHVHRMVVPPHFLPRWFIPTPNTFSGLTYGELTAIEGNEFVHTRARIQYLRNIQTFVDVSLQDYYRVNGHTGRLLSSETRRFCCLRS